MVGPVLVTEQKLNRKKINETASNIVVGTVVIHNSTCRSAVGPLLSKAPSRVTGDPKSSLAPLYELQKGLYRDLPRA